MVADALDAFGQIDVLVHNVGGNAALTPFASSTPEQWRADLEINLMTTFRCTHLVLPGVLKRSSGRIINVGSTAGFIGTGCWPSTRPRQATYTRSPGCCA